MSFGANQAVEGADEEYREACADMAAQKAAELVAAGESRAEAIKAAVEWVHRGSQADNDITGVAEVECQEPMPTRDSPPKQVAAIKAELMDDVREAVDKING